MSFILSGFVINPYSSPTIKIPYKKKGYKKLDFILNTGLCLLFSGKIIGKMKQTHTLWKNFYVLEGLDGSGTTSQLKKLMEYCDQNSILAYGTWEPTDNPVGTLIRKILHKKIKVEPETTARLFTADRYEHLYEKTNGIRARLDRGEIVICDRYLFSSLAYQSLSTGFEKVLSLNPFPIPEKLLFIDVPPEECVKRRSERDLEELFDAIAIQNNLLNNYQHAISAFNETEMDIHIIDGTLKIDEVFNRIKKLIFTDK